MNGRAAFSFVASIALITGCRARQPSAVRVVDAFSGQAILLEPKAMPPGETFSGEYVSPHTGKMRLTEKNRIVSGAYSNTIDQCNVVGTLAGRVVGNAALLRWREIRACPNGTREISGAAQLSYDAPERAEGLVQLLGYLDLVDDRGRPSRTLPWTAVKTPAVPSAVAASGQALDPRFSSSPAAMAVRVEAAGAALRAVVAEPGTLPDSLRLALVDAHRACVQAQRAVELWMHGDGRAFLPIQYCLGTRLVRVEKELARAGRPPSPGLSSIVPDRPPSTWSDANCPPPSDASASARPTPPSQ